MRRLFVGATTNRKVVVTVAALIAVATGFRAWALRGTWFYLDDFPMLAHAVTDKLDGHYLMSPYVGHLMPGARLFMWLSTQTAPLAYAPFAVFLVLMFALAGVGMARLLTTLFGVRWGIVPPLAVFLFSPMLTVSTLWWAAAANQLPALVAITWGTDAHVRYLRTGRTSYISITAAWVVFGLLFSELALIAYLFIALLTLLYFTAGRLTERFRQITREHGRALLAHGAVIVAYLAIYWPTFQTQRGEAPHQSLVSYFVEMGAKAFASAAVGGPLTWHQVWSAQFETHPSSWFLLLAWGVLIGLVLASEGSRRRGLRAVVFVAVVLTAKILLLYSGRAIFGPSLGLDVRYLFDLAPAFALFLGLAFLPVLGAVESAERTRHHWFVDNHRFVAAATVVFVALSVVSTSRHPLRHLGAGAPRPYFDTVRAQMKSQTGPIHMADASVPGYVHSSPESRYGWMLKLVSPRFSSPKVAIDDLYITDFRGDLRQATLEEVRHDDSSARHHGKCGFPAKERSVDVKLDGPVVGYGWTLRIEYTSHAKQSATITVGDVDQKVTLPAGSHTLWLPGNATYDSVRIFGLDDSPFCVQKARLGTFSLDY